METVCENVQPDVTGRVAIVLSMFNGERYLREQLDSIVRQSFGQWHLLLRDDGSADATRQKAMDFAGNHPDRVTLTEDGGDNIGLVASFSRLAQEADADYLLFSDQDDVWLPDKIAKTLAMMQDGEQQYGTATPLLVHTDLCVVDRHLRPQAPSFWKYRQLNPATGVVLHRLLVENVVTGCTMMINRPLAEMALPIPQEAVMHDWWLALVATLFGRVLHLNEATILYRQHRDNNVGAAQWGLRRMIRQALRPRALQSEILAGMRQARTLLDIFRDRMRPEQAAVVEAYAHLQAQSPSERLQALLAHHFFKQGIVRTAGFLCCTLSLRQREATSRPFLEK